MRARGEKWGKGYSSAWGTDRVGNGRECYFIMLGEGLPDKVTFGQKHKGNKLGRNLGKDFRKKQSKCKGIEVACWPVRTARRPGWLEQSENRRRTAAGVRGPDHTGPSSHCMFGDFILSEKKSDKRILREA